MVDTHHAANLSIDLNRALLAPIAVCFLVARSATGRPEERVARLSTARGSPGGSRMRSWSESTP